MPLFGKPKETKKIVGSIKNLPKYEQVVQYLSEWFKTDFEILASPLPLSNVSAEAAFDKKKISLLYPSVCNSSINFRDYSECRLDELYTGAVDEEPMVGIRKTKIRRLYMDGFVGCVNDICTIHWQDIQALVHRTKEYPLFITSKEFSLAVAPYIPSREIAWEKGKYNPESKLPSVKQEILLKKVDLNELLKQISQEGLVVIYRCPHCNANIKISKDSTLGKLRTCEHCGSEIRILDLEDLLRTTLQ